VVDYCECSLHSYDLLDLRLLALALKLAAAQASVVQWVGA